MDNSSRSLHNVVNDISVIETRGPWASKSGGELNVLFAFPLVQLKKFLDFDNPAFDRISIDVRGLRSYSVGNIPKGSVGAMEWHRARTELISAVSGKALLQCVDFDGQEREFVLDENSSIVVPPTILHTYTALSEMTRLQVIANTLFYPEDSSTHDTFSQESFYRQV